jgi:CheY-like chemotaxis protein
LTLFLLCTTFQLMLKKILIIEDDHSIRELLVELLRSEGHEVHSSENGSEALEFLKSHPLPDLIIMDLMMPVMDGYEFRAQQMKNKLWAQIPVVVMSAEASARDKVKKYGISDFLPKPVELDVILKTIKKYGF